MMRALDGVLFRVLVSLLSGSVCLLGCGDDDSAAADAAPASSDGALPHGDDGAVADPDQGLAQTPDAAPLPDAAVEALLEMRVPPVQGYNELRLPSGEFMHYAVLMTTFDQAMSDWVNGQGNYWTTVAANAILEVVDCATVADDLQRNELETQLRGDLQAKYVEKTGDTEATIEQIRLLIDRCEVPGAPEE